MSETITFTDCRIWVEDRFHPGSIIVAGGHVTALSAAGRVRGREVPCGGLAVLPALVDNHVHFREPGAEEKEDFASGSAAAAHGGAGTVLEVQNAPPLLTTPERLEAKRRIVAEKSRVRVGLYASAAPDILPHLEEMGGRAAGLKLFMAPSHGDEGRISEEGQRPFFQRAAALGMLLVVHAEDGRVLRRSIERYGGRGPEHFSKARPPEAELRAVEQALRLAGEYGTRLHVFHLTTAGAVDLVAEARARGVDVTCSTCPHYLFFTDRDVARAGGLLKVNPSIKGPQDRDRLLEAVRSGEVEIVSTDHAPHRPEEKALPFDRVPAGISSSDLFLPLMTTLVAKGRLRLRDVARLCIENPAAVHRLHGGGRLAEGEAADLVFFDPEQAWRVSGEAFRSRAKASPYVGMELTGRVAATLVGGRAVYVDRAGPLGRFLEEESPPCGKGTGPAQ